MTPDTEITIDTDEDGESITLTFVRDDSSISVGFSIHAAQLLNSYLNEAIMAVIMKQKGTVAYQKPRTRH